MSDEDGRNAHIRPITFEDRKFILQSWLYDWKEGPEMDNPGLVDDDYFGYAHKLIEDILPRAASRGSAYMCHEPGHPHLYRGYLIAEPFDNLPVVHFLKVKKTAWNKGTATALMQRFYEDFGYEKGQAVAYTFGTKDLKRKQWLEESAKRWGATYLPFLKYTLAEPGWEA